MRALQKLVRNGNSTQITIARQILVTLGWLPGESVILELLEDQTLRVRRPQESDFAPTMKPQMIYGSPLSGSR